MTTPPPAPSPGTATGGASDTGAPIRVGLLGLGRMGTAVHDAFREAGHPVVLRVDPGLPDDPEAGTAPALAGDHLGRVDVVVDVSTGPAVAGHVALCARAGTPVAVGATGWDGDRERVEATAREAGIGLLVAPNFSLGVNLFYRIVRHAARLVDAVDPRDAALHEAHHLHKADHPGGTARVLADLLVDELDGKSGWTTDLPADSPVDPDLLQVGVTRVGEVPGTHRVVLDGPHDTLELVHTARSRGGFARGAVTAARWIRGRSGVFTMDDLLDDLATPLPPTPNSRDTP